MSSLAEPKTQIFFLCQISINNLLYYLIKSLLMQCKSFESLPFETLFQMGQEKYESLDYEQAAYFYQLAYAKNPHNDMLILCLSHIYKKLQKDEQAKKILEQSLKNSPSGTYKRYFELAEIYQGVESVKIFEKGINEANKAIKNPFVSIWPQKEVKRDIAQAYASIAEVCMTDLLDQKQAQPKCMQALQKGKALDQTCIDIRIQLSNYLMFKDNFQQAQKQLSLVHSWIMQKREQYEPDSIASVAKYLIEVQQYKKSKQLYQLLHEQQSSDPQTLYMLAYCTFQLNSFQQSEQYLQQYQNMLKECDDVVDEEIESAAKQLKIELNKKKKKENDETGEGQGQEDEWMDVEEDEDQYTP